LRTESRGWGQGLFDFAGDSENNTVTLTTEPQTAEQSFQVGYEEERADRLEEAALAYRKAIQLGGPDPQASFNLANVLYALSRREQARERTHQALEMVPSHAEA
jgi:Flp pilus assembly protein TadD